MQFDTADEVGSFLGPAPKRKKSVPALQQMLMPIKALTNVEALDGFRLDVNLPVSTRL